MDTTTSSSESRCKNPACGRQLPPRTSGGHRQREYCDDACRQAARRVRLEVARRQQCIEQVSGWGAFQPATIDYLANWLYAGNEEGARRLARLIHCEQGQTSAALREVKREQSLAEQLQPRVVLTGEQARERARLHGYLDGSYLESTQRLFVSVFQTGQVEPGQMREVIHQERGAEHDRLRQCIAELEQELADACQGRDQVQERFREYVCMTNERLGELTSELAKLRQEQERAARQEDQRNIEDYREKLAQAGQRVAKLEKQVDIQRQQISQYHARFYPSSLAVAEQKLMALGAAMNYKILLKYDSHAVEVPSGEHAWCEFATHANYDDLAQAILQAQYLFDNLYALGMVGKRDN